MEINNDTYILKLEVLGKESVSDSDPLISLKFNQRYGKKSIFESKILNKSKFSKLYFLRRKSLGFVLSSL